MKNSIQLLLIFFTINAFSQFSKTHYIPPVSHSNNQDPQGQYMYISCPSTTPINFKIKAIGGAIVLGTVSRDLPYVFNIGSGFNTQMMIDKFNVSQVMSNKGYVVEADDLIYVAVRMTATIQNFQAGSIVSKGAAALGKRFRIGAFVNTFAPSTTDNHYTFATILATENNTTISFSDIKSGVSLINNSGVGSTPSDIILNQGQTFAIAVEGPNFTNKDGLIGALIEANKDIVVNCGSFAGSNGTTTNLDLGMDQIVSSERTGKEYIFIKGSGVNETERPLIIADVFGTKVYLNGSSTPYITLNSGEYLSLDGTNFTADNNLYVKTSENVFAYQGIGGSTSQANQNMHFVPPLSCGTPKAINNIPLVNEIGGLNDFAGTVCIVAETGATLDFIINGINYSLATLPSFISVTGPKTVTGNAQFVTYTFGGLSGNISVFSSAQVYLSYYGSSGAATNGGFYSGFTFNPEVTFGTISASVSGCIPNIDLGVNSLSSFDNFQWYKDQAIVVGATLATYKPLVPGYYFVRGKISACGTLAVPFDSVEIPVSDCPKNTDNDLVNDNIDLDLNNDGITNCAASFGNLNINTTNPNAGNINLSSYSNAFTSVISTAGIGLPVGTFTGNNNSFVTEVPIGKGNSVTYKVDFVKPISVAIDYAAVANASDLLNINGTFKINCPQTTTVTVLNPTNQLLIDTNYDGVYESGVTEYSSFEIRFRLNSTIPLAAGTGTFSFRSHLTNSISITHENLSDTIINKATFSLIASCVPKDTDLDGISDDIDLDSDNDGIPNFIEYQGQLAIVKSNVDANKNGIDDALEGITTASDFDNDSIPDYLDLDADNDGIFDLIESGSNALDANIVDGIVDGNPASFGANGLSNSLQNVANSGISNYMIQNTDGSGANNYISLDSDGDGCNDVIEAGFPDQNKDGFLGNNPIFVNPINGLVTSAGNYTIPTSQNFIIAAPIVINTQPIDVVECNLKNATFTISTNAVDGYQWQVSVDNGLTFSDLSNVGNYSGTDTVSLLISNLPISYNDYKYRVKLSKTGNTCGLISNFSNLKVKNLPTVTPIIAIKQCDDNTDGISDFNLTVRNNDISPGFATSTFTYFLTSAAANDDDAAKKIPNPIVYNSGTSTVWVRIVDNVTKCFTTSQLDLVVSVTQLPPGFKREFAKCDDYLDAINNNRDGISEFDFSSVTTDIQAIIPASLNYTLKYYRNVADASAEINEITNITNYRNIGYPNSQQIIGRIDSTLDNSCYGFALVNLTVEKLPVPTPLNATNIIRKCDDDHDGIFGFDTSTLENAILNGQTGISFTYFDSFGVALSSPLPNPFIVNTTSTIKIKLTNNVTKDPNGACSDEMTVQFIVDDLPTATAVNISLLEICDDETDPSLQDGKYSFDTSTFESTILNGQTGMTIEYKDASGLIYNTLPNPFKTSSQKVTVTVTNPINTTCTATTVLDFKVFPTPRINLLGDEIVCINLPLLTKTLTAGITDGTPISDYAFEWKKDGVLLTAISPTLTINQSGVYAVKVTNGNNCSNTRIITVIPSDIAHLLPPTVQDLIDVNTVNMNVTGVGVYEYSIDDIDGPYQDEPFFDNVGIGFHDFYVRDKNNCGVEKQIVAVIGAPRYFTPNNDSINDYWNIKGIEANNFNSIIYIYNRFGKLVKQIAPKSQGWDGRVNGELMPSDDYWYSLQLEDGRGFKGHFSLKR